MLDFRYYCLGAKVKELLASIKKGEGDVMATLAEYQHVDLIYKEVAKKLGR